MSLPDLYRFVFVPNIESDSIEGERQLLYVALLCDDTKVMTAPPPFGVEVHQWYERGRIIGPLFGVQFTSRYQSNGTP